MKKNITRQECKSKYFETLNWTNNKQSSNYILDSITCIKSTLENRAFESASFGLLSRTDQYEQVKKNTSRKLYLSYDRLEGPVCKV